MYMNKTFLAFIPARGGSKGIKNKNRLRIKDKPLIQYTIDEAMKSAYIDNIIVSTDDLEIMNISLNLGAEVPFMRPQELATDKSKTIEAVIHAINFLKIEQGLNYDYVVILQPTQPLRKSWHIDESIEKIVNSDKESLVSVTKVSEHPILMRTKNRNDELLPLMEMSSTVRRQDFPDYYRVNGAIYINKINGHLTNETSLNDNQIGYEMAKEYSIDIDDPFDIEVLKLLLDLKIIDRK